MDATENNAAESEGHNPMHAPAPTGCAALLLTESLMHALVANGTISREEFVEVVEGASDVAIDLAMADAVPPDTRRELLLRPLAHAFKLELGR